MRGSLGMQQTEWYSSGSVVGTGQTFLSTCLYLRIRMAGSVGRGDGNLCGVMTCSRHKGGEARLITERILTAIVRLMHSCVGTYTLHAMLVVSYTKTFTSPLGRSSIQQSAVHPKGWPKRISKDTCSTMCAWILSNMLPTCSVRFSAHPTIQFVAPLAPSISMSC